MFSLLTFTAKLDFKEEISELLVDYYSQFPFF